MIVYLDTSALVKLYVAEDHSPEVHDLTLQAQFAGSAVLAYVEMASALTKAVRMNWLDSTESDTAWTTFLAQWPAFTRIALSTPLIESAGQMARKHGLRGYDAAHLAAAFHWQQSLQAQVTLATFDRELWQAAVSEGLAVWPTNFLM
jgi:predicted nucleic acid-binding protein